MFNTYREAGLCVIPSKGGRPMVKWGEFQKRLATEEEAKSWDERYSEDSYELVCGEVSGVIALDIDTDDKDLWQKIEAFAGVSPVKKFGTKGFTAFYKYSGEKSASWGGCVEILSDKHLCAIPPGKHRKTGTPYRWIGEGVLGGCGRGGVGGVDLPTLGDGLIGVLDMLYPKPERVHYERREYDERVELDDAEDMLRYVDANCSREEWLQVGMALRDEYGDGAKWLWHEWSSKGESYKERDAEVVWRSFHGTGVGIGTLVYMARLGGFEFERDESEDYDFSSYINYLEGKAVNKVAEPDRVGLPEVGGMVGVIAEWIEGSALYPQPALALGAALSFVGFLKGHRFKSPTNARTNVYVFNTALSGAGKEHPQDCVEALMNSCNMGRYLAGEFASGPAVVTGMADNDSRMLWVQDEIARFLKNAGGKNAPAHMREIIDNVIKIFSKSGKIYKGKRYADSKLNEQRILISPHLCVLGSNTREGLEGSLGSAEVVDGFLNRWVMFASPDDPDPNHGAEGAIVPQDILQSVIEYQERYPIEHDNYGNLKIRKMKFDSAAWEAWQAFSTGMRKRAREVGYPLSALYMRLAEYAMKLAMILCDDMLVTLRNVEDAIQIVQFSTQNVLDLVGQIADNESEEEIIRVQKIIADHSPISKNDIVKRTRWLKGGRKRRDEILMDLEDAGSILRERVESGTRPKIYYKSAA